MRITIVDGPDTSGSNAHYLTHRAPLAPSPFVRLPLGAVAPAGWLRQQLDLMVEGMVGRLFEFGDHLAHKPHGWTRESGGGWEEQPYWFRGFYALAALTGDARCLAEAQRWIEGMIALQDADGYFGVKKRKSIRLADGRVIADLWPQMIMIDALILHHEFTEDGRIPELVRRFFAWCRDLPDEAFLPASDRNLNALGDFTYSIQQPRAGDFLPHLYWLYSLTGERWVLDLAHRVYRKTDAPGSLLDWTDGHNVNFAQRFPYAALYSQLTGEAHQQEFSEQRYQEMMLGWGQPRGIFGGDEYVRKDKTDVRQGFETCGMVEMAKSFYLLGRIDGRARHLDRCEDIMLNHFPAAATADWKAIHYLTATNQVQLDAGTVHDITNNGMVMFSYSPHTVYRCCQHNVAMGWPWYAANLWQATADNGLALWLYADARVTARVGVRGTPVTLQVRTDYPFDGKVVLRVRSVEGGRAATFPVYLRVPGWCRGMTVKVNGQGVTVKADPGRYVRIERAWRAGDRVDIRMPMDITVRRDPRTGAATVDRGPLSFSLKMDETWSRCGGTDQWPEYEVFPGSPWNYGLVLSGRANGIRFGARRKVAGQPWTPEAAPVELVAVARRIPAWGMDAWGTMVAPLQESPIRSEAPDELIRLIPLGCARLRIGAFPVIGEGGDARPWEAEGGSPAPGAASSAEIRVGP